MRSGEWTHDPFVGVELHGRRLGLIGHGKIGQKIERIAAGYDMKVTYVDSQSSASDIDDLLTESDVVCVCAPLNDSTRGMIDERRIALMKSTAIFVNVGRGAIVDQHALAAALTERRIFGAGLDVFVDEPLSGTPNETIVALARLDNVVAVPHIAYKTFETRHRLGAELTSVIDACLAGRPINVVG